MYKTARLLPYPVILSEAKYPQNQSMDSSPAAQNDKAQTNALRATCHTERSIHKSKRGFFATLKMTFGRLSLGSLCRKPLVKSRNWWFVSKCRSKNSALAKNLRKIRLNLQDFERILGENMAWKWAFEVLKNGYLRWVRACENLGLEKRDTKIFKGRFFKGVKFCDLAKWDLENFAPYI